MLDYLSSSVLATNHINMRQGKSRKILVTSRKNYQAKFSINIHLNVRNLDIREHIKLDQFKYVCIKILRELYKSTSNRGGTYNFCLIFVFLSWTVKLNMERIVSTIKHVSFSLKHTYQQTNTTAYHINYRDIDIGKDMRNWQKVLLSKNM